MLKKIIFFFITVLFAFNASIANELSDPDKILKKVLTEIANQNIDQAIADVNSLIAIAPNFTVAKIIKSDLLVAKTMAINEFGSGFRGANQDLEELKLELQKRVHVTDPEKFQTINAKYKFLLDDAVPFFLFVDLKKSRMIVFQNKNNKLQPISDHYVSIGKKGYGKKQEGDQRTPVGVYFLRKKIQDKLPDKYGDGAYPLNYPNAIDKMNGNTGYGIWIHGVSSKKFSQPPYSSDGCIVLTNHDLKKIEHILDTPNIPVVVSDVSLDDILDRDAMAIDLDINEFRSKIESWRATWEKGNFNDYLSFYSNNAIYNYKDYHSWTNHKLNVFLSSKNIKVSIDNLSFFEQPGSNLILVKFNQHYKSNLLENKMMKQQIWTRENNEWKILSEGNFI